MVTQSAAALAAGLKLARNLGHRVQPKLTSENATPDTDESAPSLDAGVGARRGRRAAGSVVSFDVAEGSCRSRGGSTA